MYLRQTLGPVLVEQLRGALWGEDGFEGNTGEVSGNGNGIKAAMEGGGEGGGTGTLSSSVGGPPRSPPATPGTAEQR